MNALITTLAWVVLVIALLVVTVVLSVALMRAKDGNDNNN